MITKSVTSLSVDDLAEHTLWEFVTDSESDVPDETHVRPLKAKHVPKGRYFVLVSAQFTAANGSENLGFMIANTSSKPVRIDVGALIGSFGCVSLPSVDKATAIVSKFESVLVDRENVLRSLKQTEGQVFPIRYKLLVPVMGEHTLRTGTIE